MIHFCLNQRLETLRRKRNQFHLNGSAQTEVSGESQADLQKDDTAPKPEQAKRLYYGADITGNEDDSVFRKLSRYFTDGYHGEWAGSTIKVIQLQLNIDVSSGM